MVLILSMIHSCMLKRGKHNLKETKKLKFILFYVYFIVIRSSNMRGNGKKAMKESDKQMQEYVNYTRRETYA